MYLPQLSNVFTPIQPVVAFMSKMVFDFYGKPNNWFFMKRRTRLKWMKVNPGNIYLFKINNRNTRKRCEACSK